MLQRSGDFHSTWGLEDVTSGDESYDLGIEAQPTGPNYSQFVFSK